MHGHARRLKMPVDMFLITKLHPEESKSPFLWFSALCTMGKQWWKFYRRFFVSRHYFNIEFSTVRPRPLSKRAFAAICYELMSLQMAINAIFMLEDDAKCGDNGEFFDGFFLIEDNVISINALYIYDALPSNANYLRYHGRKRTVSWETPLSNNFTIGSGAHWDATWTPLSIFNRGVLTTRRSHQMRDDRLK